MLPYGTAKKMMISCYGLHEEVQLRPNDLFIEVQRQSLGPWLTFYKTILDLVQFLLICLH